ncbi:MAG: hypothetical protein QNJ14_12665 [Woeseiaceae bacterium]|nr:hypothetical protein [Woeseiaceae bacterium]
MNIDKTYAPTVIACLLTIVPCSNAGELPLDDTPLWQLAMYVGDWEIDETWEDGTEIWSRNEFRVGLGDEFLEIRTYAKDEEGNVYQRYFTIFAYDKLDQAVKSYGFTYDGTVTIVDNVKLDGSVADASVTSQWGEGDNQFRQTIRIASRDEYSWKVWTGNGNDWEMIMDGTWNRVD